MTNTSHKEGLNYVDNHQKEKVANAEFRSIHVQKYHQRKKKRSKGQESAIIYWHNSIILSENHVVNINTLNLLKVFSWSKQSIVHGQRKHVEDNSLWTKNKVLIVSQLCHIFHGRSSSLSKFSPSLTTQSLLLGIWRRGALSSQTETCLSHHTCLVA